MSARPKARKPSRDAGKDGPDVGRFLGRDGLDLQAEFFY
jgi:hypothetical protein